MNPKHRIRAVLLPLLITVFCFGAVSCAFANGSAANADSKPSLGSNPPMPSPTLTARETHKAPESERSTITAPPSPPVVELKPKPPVQPDVRKEASSHVFALAALFMEVVGLLLLAREVHKGHKMEKVAHDFEFAKQMLFLYTKKDFEGFYLASRLDQGDTPEKARNWTTILSQANMQKAVEDQWTELAPKVAKHITTYEEHVRPAAIRTRRLCLGTGTLLLVSAAVLRHSG